MPVRRSRFAARPAEVERVAREVLHATRTEAGTLRFDLPGTIGAGTEARAALVADDEETIARFEADPPPRIPYFFWFLGPVVRAGMKRSLLYTERAIEARLQGRDPPASPRRRSLMPPVSFADAQIVLVATACAVAAVSNFGGALFGQNAGFITRSFDVSDRALGFSLAITRAGVLVSLVAAAMADRRGRRILMLASVVGVCVFNGLSAVAPNLELFTLAQTVVRGFVNAALTVAAIAVIEEAPERARAYSVAMITLAAGAGFAASVAVLPLADLGPWGWRISFAVSALAVVMVPGFARKLKETERFAALRERDAARGSVRQVLGPSYGARFLLLLAAALFINVFNAPAGQLTNEFLTEDRGFSGVGISLFRTVTTLLPGLLGIVIGGRLAETRGRRPMAAGILFLATIAEIAFFLGQDWVLWVSFALAGFLGSASAPAIAAFGPELFPTEVRGTANALLLIAGLAGSVIGLVLAGVLSGTFGDLGQAIAVLGVTQLIAAAVFVPRLPEPAGRELDELSPSQI